MSAHLALAVAGHAVRVQRQERALEMSSRTAQFTQGDLELLGLLEGVTLQQIVDRQVGMRRRTGRWPAQNLSEKVCALDGKSTGTWRLR